MDAVGAGGAVGYTSKWQTLDGCAVLVSGTMMADGRMNERKDCAMPFGFIPSIGPSESLILLAATVLLVWPAWRICSKAGFPGTMGLLVVVPGLNLVLLYVLAFAEWPVRRGGNSGADRAV